MSARRFLRHVLTRRFAVAACTVLSLAVPAVVSVSLTGQSRSTGGDFPAYRAPRLDGHPDLNGIWQAFVTANVDLEDHDARPGPHPELMGAYGAEPPGQSIIEGGRIPYQPSALARKKENYDKRMTVDVSNDKSWHALGDPELKCYMPGVPRATYLPHPFQIVQGSSPYILISYSFASATRTIRMHWQERGPIDAWMGWSRGRWEGDTLVVDVTDQREESWLDRAGDFHTSQLHVVERYTPVSPYHLMYEATIEDPGVYTRPWKIRFPLYRRMERNLQLLEFKCVPFTEELLYGKFRKPAGGAK
jgi:hypothetical protein